MSTISPSSNRLPTVTADKLQRVCQRRKQLLVLKSIAIAVSTFLGVLLIAALVDMWWNITPSMRWGLSSTVYGLATAAAVVSLLPFFKTWGLNEAANLIEQLVPRLKNRVMAAVDLAVDSDDPKFGSKSLRDRLQQNVAEQIDDLHVGEVLPWKHAQRTLIVCGSIAAAVLVLCLIPNLQLPQHLLRMLLPAANIARPSLADIKLLTPEKPEAAVPLNERLLVRAAIEFKHAGDQRTPRFVQLEWRATEAGAVTQLQPMTAELTNSDSQGEKTTDKLVYQTSLDIKQPQQQFRILSDVGESIWYTLRAFPRPKVERYQIEVHAPEYAQMEPVSMEATAADVEVIMGGKVKLGLQASEVLSQATLRWLDTDLEEGEKTSELWKKSASDQWQLELQPERTRRFQVDLVSEHGIESTFPLTYRMTVREDQAPKLQWIEPKESARVIRPKSAARMTIAFKDEYPLRSMEQWTRINRGEWSKRPMSLSQFSEDQLTWTWELAGLGLKLGDMVDTKVVATDRKGSVGESAVIEWIISGTELDPSREDATLAREEIADALRQLGEYAKTQTEVVKELRTAWHGDRPNSSKEQALQTAHLEIGKSIAQMALDVNAQIQQRMGRVPNLVSREELIQTMDALAFLEREAHMLQTTWLERLEHERLRAGNSHKATDDLHNWQERILYSAQRINESYLRMVPHDVLADFGRDLIDAARYEEELLRDPTQVGEEIWNREQRVLADHLRSLGRDMLAHSGYLPEGPSRGLSDWAGWAEQLAERMESFCAQDPPKNDQEKKQRLDEVLRMVGELQYHSRVHQTHSGLQNELISGRRELVQIAGRPNEVVTKAIQEWQSQRATLSDPALLPPQFFAQVEQLAQRRESHLSAGEYSALFGADLGLAHRAALHQAELNRGDIKKTEEVMQAIQECLAILETESRLKHIQRWMEQMQAEERFAANGKTAITENPRMWDSWGVEIEYVQDYIRRSQIRNESADVLNGLRWGPPAQAAGQKFGQRRWEQKPAVSASSELDSIQNEISAQYALLKDKFDEARDRLRQLAPTIPELAKEAAQLARDQQQKTEKLLEDFKEGEVPNVDERLNQNAEVVSERQTEVSEQLKEALTDLAASQNVLDKDELQVAKTADLAQALQQRAEEKRDQAFEKALAAEDSQTTPALEQLAKSQAKEAETLEAIAEHYEQDPLAPKSSADPSQESSLENLAQALDAQPQNLDAYEDAEQMARLAEADPRELMRRLEEELKTNEEMQEELSEIAQNLAEQAQESLEQAAEREKNIRSSLLQSDPLREPRRQEMAQEVNNALDQANRLAQRLAQETRSQARLGKQNEENEKIEQIANDLYKAIDQARQQASTQLPEDMKKAAEQLAQSLQAVQPQIEQAAQSLAQGKQEQQFDDANKLQQAKNNAERTQSQVHEQDQRYADQNMRMREQRKQAAERNVQQAQQQATQAEQQRDQLREQANKNPESEGLKRALANAEADVQEKKALQAMAEQAKTQADQKLTEAQQERAALENKPGSLDAASPNTELAERLANQVAQRAAELGQNVQKMVAESSWIDQVEASRQQLAGAATQQQTLQEAVSDAARDLDRAANHQARLNAPQSAQSLADAAQRVNNTANNEAQQAEDRLAEAGKQEGAANPRYASADETRNATNALQNSQNSLEARADELGKMLAAQEGAAENSSPQGNSAENNSAQNTPAENNTPLPTESAQANEQLAMENNAGESSQDQPANSTPGENQTAANSPNSNQSPNGNSNPSETGTPSQEQMANNSSTTPSNSDAMQQGDSPLSPREMAQLLDELDRQLRDPSGNIKPDALSQSANKDGSESLATLRNTQQQISQQLQQMRSSAESQVNNPTMVVSRQPSQARTSQGILIPNPEGSGSSKVFSTDQLTGEPLGAWSRLREKKSEEVAESQRESVAPRYRRQIENYFRTLSERSVKQ